MKPRPRKLRDQVRDLMRLKHYSVHVEGAFRRLTPYPALLSAVAAALDLPPQPCYTLAALTLTPCSNSEGKEA